MFRAALATLASCAILFTANASAGVIISPESATASSTAQSNTFDWDISNTIDQSGLYSIFENRVSDFDTYIASNPYHGWASDGQEWFSERTSSVTINYDLGSTFTVNALALWNENGLGLAEAEILYSLNGIDYFQLTTIIPTPGESETDYLPQVFSFAATALQYIRMELDCTHTSENRCGIGEIAFRVADINEVPIPAAFPLLLSGLAGLGFAARRRKRVK